jgi:hypothetical protein
MTNPDTIAHLIEDEVDRTWKSGAAFGEEQVFVDEAAGKELLRLRFLCSLAMNLFEPRDNVREMLEALLVLETFLAPVAGPSSDAAETAAETLLNFGQNLYDEFRTE